MITVMMLMMIIVRIVSLKKQKQRVIGWSQWLGFFSISLFHLQCKEDPPKRVDAGISGWVV